MANQDHSTNKNMSLSLIAEYGGSESDSDTESRSHTGNDGATDLDEIVLKNNIINACAHGPLNRAVKEDDVDYELALTRHMIINSQSGDIGNEVAGYREDNSDSDSSTSSDSGSDVDSVKEIEELSSRPQSELEKIRSQRALKNKRIRALSPATKKRLINAKRQKELSRFLLPDAPASKRKRQGMSPPRIKCPMAEVLSTSAISTTPSSGGSTASIMKVESLSPHYWRGGPDDKIDIKQGHIRPKINIQSDIQIKPRVNPIQVAVPNISVDTEFGGEEEFGEEAEEAEDCDMAALAPAVVPLDFGREQELALGMADLADDRALRELAPPDLLKFNWTNNPRKFKGTREQFTGKAGPTFPLSELSCPLDAFQKIWDVEFLDMIVQRTNSYAAKKIAAMGPLQKNSRFRTWTPTDRQEIIRFFALCQLHSLAHLPVEKDYFKTAGYCAMPEMASLMTYSRFILIKRFLNFADPFPHNDLTDQQKRLFKIQPVIDKLTNKFKNLYMPGQSIAIDESLLLWKGRLAFAQKIGNKAAKVGIKSFELCESATGYLWNFFIYGGAAKAEQKADSQTDRHQNDEDRQTDETDRFVAMPDGPTAKVVYDLARPLFNLGHTLVMDNYYNSPLLARCLKKQKTDVLGTLRVNREFVPDSIKFMAKTEMRVGEIACSSTDDLSILLWRDANLISVVSTYHKVEVAPKEKYGKVRYKPQAVLDYNVLMGGVDKKDQLLSAYLLERTRNQVWYKKLFLRLMNVSILNSYIIYKCKFNIEHRRFRNILAEALVAASQPPTPSTAVKTTPMRSTAKDRTKLTGNHFIAKGPSRHSVCVWCRMHRNRKTRTVYVCEQCGVSLCLEDCFKEYHS